MPKGTLQIAYENLSLDNLELKDEMKEVSNQLIELYNKCNEMTEPDVYGTILGLHERLEQFLNS